MDINRLIIELQKIQLEHGNLRVLSLPPKGPVTCTTPQGHIWAVKVVEQSWGKEVIIEAA
jgi:hypothetical protein